MRSEAGAYKIVVRRRANDIDMNDLGPGIFIDYFDRSDAADVHYAAMGRALWLGSRFEGACKALAIILGIKTGAVVPGAGDTPATT